MATEHEPPILVWLRHDLRLDDNPALFHAAQTGRPVIALFILADGNPAVRPYGGAHRWWLHHSLKSLGAAFEGLGSRLILKRGDTLAVLQDVLSRSGATTLHLNRRYGPEAKAVDGQLESHFPDVDIRFFDASLLHDPDTVRTGSGGYYRVYTPFMKSALADFDTLRALVEAPSRLKAPQSFPTSESLDAWKLLPTRPDWAKGFAEGWTPGEDAGRKRLEHFCKDLLAHYTEGRDAPALDGTSRLSPHLHFGEVSALRALKCADAAASRRRSIPEKDHQTFTRELLWRDFNHHLLYHFHDLGSRNFNGRFDRLKWRDAPSELAAWQKGQTGYPIVDAGMRQLWQTGWMHNRVRMIAGSFLTKDLLIDWRAGEAWFWDTLVDGDEANNTSQWQWIAGTGADAQPFFRIFNPLKQSRDFDRTGAYIRRYVPELASLPDKHIHAPWEAGADILRQAGVVLGKTYPKPMVDHGMARERAMAAFQETR